MAVIEIEMLMVKNLLDIPGVENEFEILKGEHEGELNQQTWDMYKQVALRERDECIKQLQNQDKMMHEQVNSSSR